MENHISPEVAGLNLVHYSNSLNKRFSDEDLRKFLKNFQLNKALSLIGTTSYNLFKDSRTFGTINKKPVAEYILAYISIQFIKSSNDYKSKVMTDIDLAFACEMYFNLEDPVYQDYKFDEFNVRLGNSQLDFDRERRNSLSRALVIYKKLWNEFDHNQLNIESCIKEITGLRIEESLFLSYFFALSSQKGYFRRVDLQEATKTDKENSKIINALSPLKQKIFIDY